MISVLKQHLSGNLMAQLLNPTQTGCQIIPRLIQFKIVLSRKQGGMESGLMWDVAKQLNPMFVEWKPEKQRSLTASVESKEQIRFWVGKKLSLENGLGSWLIIRTDFLLVVVVGL